MSDTSKQTDTGSQEPQEAVSGRTTIDPAEVAHFSRIASEWWNPQGKFRPLHKFNPTRLEYLKEQICKHFNRNPLAAKPLEGLRILDIGCGGGLLCEPMARLGATVIGADASATNIEVAKIHATEMGIEIDYRATTAEALADAGEQFDIVLNMEVVEHVSDVDLFMSATAKMVKPQGQGRRHHQPPAARRQHGLHPVARQHLDRIASEGRAEASGRAVAEHAEHRELVSLGRRLLPWHRNA